MIHKYDRKNECTIKKKQNKTEHRKKNASREKEKSRRVIAGRTRR